MNEDTTQDLEVTTQDAETETTTETPSERTFTQADVEAIVKQRLDRDRRDRKSRTTKKPKARTKAQPKQEAEETQVDRGALRDSFYDAIHGRDFKLAHIKKMRAEFLSSPPDDPDAWVDEWAELVGAKTADKEPEPEQEEPKQKAAPVSDKPEASRGAPQGHPDYDTVIDPNRLEADDIRRMEEKYGQGKAWKKLRAMVERHYRGRKVVI